MDLETYKKVKMLKFSNRMSLQFMPALGSRYG